MNLADHPSRANLKVLLALADDEEGSHMIWVSETGEVHIEVLPDYFAPAAYVKELPGFRFRLETLHKGNGWTGPVAASDDNWVDRLYASLTQHWKTGTQGYVDEF
jgi:hypothetical protein